MNGVQDISWIDLAIGYLLIVIPIIIFRYYQTGMVRSTIIAVIRMGVQLFLVGLYLEYIFTLNNLLDKYRLGAYDDCHSFFYGHQAQRAEP